MKWTQEKAQWAISQLDAFNGDVGRARYDTELTLRSLGHYSFAVGEHADRWFRQLLAQGDVEGGAAKVAERIAKVRALAAPAKAEP